MKYLLYLTNIIIIYQPKNKVFYLKVIKYEIYKKMESKTILKSELKTVSVN